MGQFQTKATIVFGAKSSRDLFDVMYCVFGGIILYMNLRDYIILGGKSTEDNN